MLNSNSYTNTHAHHFLSFGCLHHLFWYHFLQAATEHKGLKRINQRTFWFFSKRRTWLFHSFSRRKLQSLTIELSFSWLSYFYPVLNILILQQMNCSSLWPSLSMTNPVKLHFILILSKKDWEITCSVYKVSQFDVPESLYSNWSSSVSSLASFVHPGKTNKKKNQTKPLQPMNRGSSWKHHYCVQP